MADIFQTIPSRFTKVQHNVYQELQGGCVCLRIAPAIWPSLEMRQERLKLQARFMPQSCPIQGQEQLPNPNTIERIKTCTAS